MTSTRTGTGTGMAAEPAGELVALGAEVARLRVAARLSPSELADRAGLSLAVVRQYERGTAGPVDLGDLHAIAAALGTTAGALVDAPPPGTRRGPLVLLPTRLEGAEHSATVWRLVEYLPRQLGQRWERAERTDPGRTVSGYVLDWAAELFHTRVQVFGSATELTGNGPGTSAPAATPTHHHPRTRSHRPRTGGHDHPPHRHPDHLPPGGRCGGRPDRPTGAAPGPVRDGVAAADLRPRYPHPVADLAQHWQPVGAPPAPTGPTVGPNAGRVPALVSEWVAAVLGPHAAIGPAANTYAGPDSWHIQVDAKEGHLT